MELSELEQLQKLEQVMEALPGKLETNPYDYEAYTEWIRLLSQVGDIDSVRGAMERMHTVLAIPSDLWTMWIEKELNEAADADNVGFKTADSVRQIVHVFELATAEYLSLDMWQRYIDYARLQASDPEYRAAAEAAFESANFYLDTLQKAYAATCAHYSQSQAIWNQLKEGLEQEVASSEDADTPKLINVLQQMFIDRLSQPHAGLDETFAAYSGFITTHKNDNYEAEMVQANQIVCATRAQCEKREKFEEELAATGNSWSVFSAYIDSMQRDKSVSTFEVQTLYERALCDFYYSASAWDEYIGYVLDGPKDEPLALDLANRGRSNCPWSGKLWAHAISSTYSVSGKHEALNVYYYAMSTHALEYSMAEYSLAAIALIDVARLEFQLNRGTSSADLLSTCTSCITTAYSLPIETADPMLRLERYSLFVTAAIAKDIEATRGLWTKVCRARRSSAEAWVLAADFETAHGSVANARSLYRQGAQRKLDNPARLFDAWLAFEHSVGNLATIRSAEHVVNSQTNLIQRRAEREAARQPEQAASEQADTMSQKRRRGRQQQSEEPVEVSALAMDVVPEPTKADDAESSENAQPKDEGMQSKRPKDKQTADGVGDDGECKTTVFVSNLPFTASKTEVAEFLGGSDQVKVVAMLKNQQGKFRGQARVEMASPVAYMGALGKNGTKLQKRAILVQEYAKPSSRPHQPHTHRPPPDGESIRIVGFAPATTNDYIASVAKQAGEVTNVYRTYQGDKIFLTMESAAAALKAVELLNGHKADGKKIRATVAQSKSATHGTSDVAAASLVPRKAAKHPTKKLAASAKAPKQKDPEDVVMDDPAGDSTAAPAAAPKSNDDFRKMFLN